MLDNFNKQFSVLNKIAAFVTTVSIIGGAYYYYRTTIWRPAINIISIDWEKLIAKIRIGKSQIITLYPN